MAEDKRTRANRTNALASTGPKTAAGKAASSTNALRHGLRSKALVVHGLESEEDWNAHLRGVMESCQPANYLESFLAADVAALTWRLARVARYESDAATVAQEMVETQTRFGWDNNTLAELAGRAKEAEWAAVALQALSVDKPDDTPIPSAPTVNALCLLAEEGCVDMDTDEFDASVPESLQALGWDSYQNTWLLGMYRHCAQTICDAADEPLDTLLVRASALADRNFQAANRELTEAEAEATRLRRGALLPSAPELEKLARYESHLRRSLDRTLAQLHNMQAGPSAAR